jgi:Mg2+/Co2+ transporter CorB
VDNPLWLVLLLLVLLDLFFAAVRTALVNTHTSKLTNLEGQNPYAIQATLKVSDSSWD